MKNNLKAIFPILALVLILSACSNSGSDEFSYSGAFDKNGFWKGIKASKYVTLCECSGISVPASVHEVSESTYTATVNELLSDLAEEIKVTDRAVADGDTLNIDYVGTVDGVEFDGGSTKSSGAQEVTIGVTKYIDGFLEQLIGHMPGETFDINVRFPDDYGKENLNGKDAIFSITVNHIIERSYPDITDELVNTNFASDYGWTTAEQFRTGVLEGLKSDAVETYIQDYLEGNCTISSLPQKIYDYQVDSLIDFYQGYADSNNMSLEAFLAAYTDYDSTDKLIEAYRETNTDASNYFLIIQAIAEQKDISVSDNDVAAYFLEYYGSTDYSQYEEFYGLPYLKWITLTQAVTDYIADNAVYQ